jgi:DUF971 family protein
MGSHQKKSSPSSEDFKHMIIHVVAVKYLGDFRLHLEFDDGHEKDIDMWPLIENFGGVFEMVKEKEFFAKVAVDEELGTIVWPNGADFAPDVLYQAK